MGLVRTEALVLGTRALGEQDRLVSLYTRNLGRLTAVARGARRLRSRFGGALEPFTWGEALGFEREGRGLLRLDQFAVRCAFRAIREDLDRLGQGARILEAVLRLTPERDPAPAAFDFLLRALRALETGPPARVQLAFSLGWLDHLGYRPRLDRCVGCGRRPGHHGVGFDAARGGLVCAGCRAPGDPTPGVSAGALAALRGLQRAPWSLRLRVRLPRAAEAEASALLDGYLARLAGTELRAPAVAASLVAEPGGAPTPASGR